MKKHLHHRLVTRRDFLAQGIITFGATMTLPSLFGRGLSAAALECGGDSQLSTMTPFMAFDMAGGAALPGNFLVGKEGGPEDLLASYDKLGWNPRESGSLNKDFGLPMSTKYSKLLQGILANSSAEARKNLRMGAICHSAQDDTSSNKLNAASLILQAGFRGAMVSNGIGIIDSLSGGNSAPVMSNIALKPTVVRSIIDVLGATNYGGATLAPLKLQQKKVLAESAMNINKLQALDYVDQVDGKELSDLAECAYEKSLSFLESAQGLDPRLDATTSAVYQLQQNSNPADSNSVAATLSMNTIKANSGPSTWTLGGCDYHDGTQTTGDGKDLEMGVQIGRAIELAFRLRKPFFFQLLTDGGCDSSPGSRSWRGDSGDKCMTVIGYYSPTAPPKMTRQQVGFYTDGQGAERSTLIGSEPALVGYAVLANYLNIHGKLSDFRTLAPGVFPQEKQLKSVLLFDAPV